MTRVVAVNSGAEIGLLSLTDSAFPRVIIPAYPRIL